MRRFIFAIAGVITVVLTGCKFETLSNGNLDGFWHMTTVDTLATGKTRDVNEERFFWSVQGRLLQLRQYGNPEGGYSNTQGYYMRFSQTSTELVLSEPYINGWHQDYGDNGGDTPLKDSTQLVPYGINKVPEHFAIEEMTSSKMSLRSQTVRLHFIKQ